MQLPGATVALAVFAEAGQQSRRQCRAGTREWLKQQVIIGQLGGRGGDFLVKAIDGLEREAQLFDQDLGLQLMCLDDGPRPGSAA